MRIPRLKTMLVLPRNGQGSVNDLLRYSMFPLSSAGNQGDNTGVSVSTFGRNTVRERAGKLIYPKGNGMPVDFQPVSNHSC